MPAPFAGGENFVVRPCKDRMAEPQKRYRAQSATHSQAAGTALVQAPLQTVTSDQAEEILQTIWHYQPGPNNIGLAFIDEHMTTVLADEKCGARVHCMTLTINHGTPVAGHDEDDFLILIVGMFTDIATRRNSLRSKTNRVLHRNAMRGENNID